MVTGKTTIDNIDWLLAADLYEDSLVVFSKNRKRGYFNCFTGEVVIPEQYTHAWIFSEGLASVAKNGKIGFVDGQGNTVIDFQFPYVKDNKKQVAFVFRNGYCSMYDASGNYGIINKKGEWVLKSFYTCIHTPQYGKRIFDDGKMSGVLDDSLHILLPAEYKNIELVDGYLIVDRLDGIQMQIAYNGEILNENLYHSVDVLEYSISEKTKDGKESVTKPTGLYSYSVYNAYGLMGENGKPLTLPIYDDITVVSKDLYLCSLRNRYSNIINCSTSATDFSLRYLTPHFQFAGLTAYTRSNTG